MFSALQHRRFALLWGGQTISRLGDSLYHIALIWWVLEKTGSATIMGTVLIFDFVPMLIFLLVGGVLVDRLPAVRVMIASDLVRFLLVGALALLASAGRLQIWHILTAAAIFGFVDAFFQPAYAVTVPATVSEDRLPSANSLTGLSKEISGFAGPALGALIVAHMGIAAAFAMDAFSFLVSTGCLLPVSGAAPSAQAATHFDLWRDFREGLRAVTGSPYLWITIALSALVVATEAAPFQVVPAFLVQRNLHGGVNALGLIYAMFALGSGLGALYLARLKRIRSRGLMTYVPWLISGFMLMAMGLPIGLVGVAAASFIAGLTVAFTSLIWINTLQDLVPRPLLGRVSSIDALGTYILMPVGFSVSGWATDRFGAPRVLVIAGALTCMLIAMGIAHPAVRELD